MMKNLKKSEIIVYVVALMLVTAGYFNYTANYPEGLVETYSEDIQKLEDTANTNIGDAVLVSNNEIDMQSNDEETENVALVENDKLEDMGIVENNEVFEKNSKDASESENKVEEVNNNISETNYYASSKLERETMYASMLSTYQNIINNNNVSEVQKSIASQEITKINNTKNSIMICENLIMTKGFDNCVILINENSVNVVVNVKNGLSTEKVAQIQNIISREIGTEIENIHIMEK